MVGGGIGGLALAIACRRRGIDVSVYEAAEEMRAVGAGIWIPPNGTAALRRLGVADRVVDEGVVLDGTAVETTSGTELTTASFRDADEPMVCVHRATLHRGLRDELPDDVLHLGRECVDVHRREDGAAATFADGTTVEVDLLVGADGVDSTVRTVLFPDVTPEYAGFVSFRGVADRPLPGERHRTGQAVWGDDRRVGFAGLDDDRTYWWAGLHTDRDDCRWAGAEARERVARAFADFPDPMPDLVEATAPGDVLRTELRYLPKLDAWHDGRIALLGDAAHATVPTLAQGGAQALEDAVVLATELDERGIDETALEAYERARKGRTERIGRQSRIQNRASAVTNPVLRRLRNWGFRLTPQFVVRRATATTFDPVV